MCKIIFLALLLLMLIGLINRKILRFIAICAVFVLLCKEIAHLYKKDICLTSRSCSVCNFFENLVSSRYKHKETKSFDVPASPESSLAISSLAGKITISSWEKEIVQVHAEKRTRKKKELQAIQIAVNKGGDNVITINDADSFARADKNIRGQVDYEIKVPKKLESITIDTRAGSIQIDNVDANVEVKTSSGGLQITTVTGDVTSETRSGNIMATNISGNMRAKCSSGGINIVNVTGDVMADVRSGNIYMSNIQKTIEAQASSGNITLKNVLNAVNAFARSGNIAIERSAQATGKIIAKTTSGHAQVSDSSGDIISQGKNISID